MLDIVIILASAFFIVFSALQLGNLETIHILIYIILLVNGLLIATAFHIFVLGIGIISTAVDNTIMVYRDLTQMGRLPVDIYQEPLRGIITFIIPIGIMMTFPGKAIMGLLTWQAIGIALFIGISLLLISLRFWKYALGNYTSASS